MLVDDAGPEGRAGPGPEEGLQPSLRQARLLHLDPLEALAPPQVGQPDKSKKVFIIRPLVSDTKLLTKTYQRFHLFTALKKILIH